RAKRVERHPPFWRSMWACLPPDLCGSLEKTADSNLQETIQTLGPDIRGFLAAARMRNDLSELTGEVSKKLKGTELVHTIYFDNKQICDLIAYIIHRHDPGLAHNFDPDSLQYAELAACYGHIRPKA